MISPNVETFIGCDSSYRAADIVLYGAPFDSTTSYRPGARFGPSAIRHESFGLETYSPYQNADLTDFDIFDSGDLELCFGSSEAALADIEARAAEILHDGKLPLLLGGEHLVTLGAVRTAPCNAVEYGGCRDMSDINRLMRCRFQPLRPADTSPIFCVAKHRGGVSDSHSKAICNHSLF